MSKLIAIVGASGVGKTALVSALAIHDEFEVAYEQHAERPFQSLFKNDARYALANQIDYFLLRRFAEFMSGNIEFFAQFAIAQNFYFAFHIRNQSGIS